MRFRDFETSRYRRDQFLEAFDRFGSLGEEVDGAAEVEAGQGVGCFGAGQFVELFGGFDDDGGIVGLALETDHFGMSGLAVNDYLRR